MSFTGKADEMNDEMSLIKIMVSRRGKLGVLTRKRNEINSMLEAGESREIINKHVDAFNNYLGEFTDLQVSVQNLFSNEAEREADHMDWYEPKLINFRDFLCYIKEWLTGDVEKRDKQDEQKKQEELGEQEEANALLVGGQSIVCPRLKGL